nr:atherin [Oryctolagus cuniculus]
MVMITVNETVIKTTRTFSKVNNALAKKMIWKHKNKSNVYRLEIDPKCLPRSLLNSCTPGGRRGSRGPVPVVRGAQLPQPGPQSLWAAGAARQQHPHLPRALRQPRRAERLSPTWRRASRTSRRDPALLGTRSARARTGAGDPARPPPPPPPRRSSGGRRRTCCAACQGRSPLPAPPQPHNNMAAAASAGSRGAGRQATGRAADGPPAGHLLPPSGARSCPGAAAHPGIPGTPDPVGLLRSAPLGPRGGRRSGPGRQSWSCDDPPDSSQR